MVVYNCHLCQLYTPNKYNYEQHLKTNKHLHKFGQLQSKNEEKKCIDNTEYNHDSLIEST